MGLGIMRAGRGQLDIRLLLGTSVGGKEQLKCVNEFTKQHIDCVQYLCLQSKHREWGVVVIVEVIDWFWVFNKKLFRMLSCIKKILFR